MTEPVTDSLTDSTTIAAIGPHLLTFIRRRITQIYPEQIRRSAAALTDEQLWWRPNESSNSVANLMLHLAGSLNHYLNLNIGGIAYDRDRETEFAERRPIPRDELLAIFNGMVANADTTFDGLTVESLAAPSAEPERYASRAEDLLSIMTHFSNHAGQVMWIAKMFQEGVLDELWMKTHKHLGGWSAT
ncbi:MAG: hypothetical protein JWO56_2245 [Acidobacteria bacterium]|nr:hypothetical protein [Acidobacteriota bacterium]